MTRIGPLRRGALLVTGLLTAVGGSLATGSAAHASPSAPSTGQLQPPAQRQAAGSTDLTLVVRGCDRCDVQLVRAIDGEADHVWTSKLRRVGPDHQVSFQLRTARTHGLSFVIDAPWGGNTGAVPNMVTRYAGHRVGTVVHRADARAAHRAEGCWAGTQADTARLRFQVDRVAVRTVDGHRAKAPLVYSRHTLPSWKPMVHTYRGTIGNQDAFYCERP